MNEEEKRIAMVTGASRGIGRAIALQLGRDGYDIAFCFHSASEAAESLARELREMGRRVYAKPCDVADYEAVQRFVGAARAELGPSSAVVNSAGIVRDGPLVTMDKSQWDAVIDTNLSGVFNVCRAAVFGFMKEKRGCIVNLSSVAGVYGNATQTNYSASKAGIIGFTRALAKEVGPYGVRANAVAPGIIVTDMVKQVAPKVIDRMLGNIPLRRLGEAQEVADLVSFLVSDRARYITGQTIHVDGGILV